MMMLLSLSLLSLVCVCTIYICIQYHRKKSEPIVYYIIRICVWLRRNEVRSEEAVRVYKCVYE